MNHKRRLELKKKLEDKIELAITQGMKGTPDDFKAAVDQAESYSKLMVLTEPPLTRDSAIALVIAVVVLFVIGILWSWKVGHTNITLVAETERIRTSLGKDWSIDNSLRGDSVKVEHLSALHNPNLGLLLDDASGNIWFRLDGGVIAVQTLQIARAANIDASLSVDKLTFSIAGAPVRGAIWVTGKGVLPAGNSSATVLKKAYDLPVPETLDFDKSDSHNTPAQVEIHSPGEWSFGIIPSDNLNFSYELRSLSGRQVLSGLRGGTLQFNDTSWPVTQLIESQLLSLSETGAARVRISRGREAMHVTVDGPASHVTIGEGETRREIAPSFLEYLYNRKNLVLFWAGVTAGWGILWGIRKIIFR
jgi:hypothetical protein